MRKIEKPWGKARERISQERTPEGVLLRLRGLEILESTKRLAVEIGRRWPKNLSAVELMRKEKRW